jgi:demethylspheroidene O-methyltransferase
LPESIKLARKKIDGENLKDRVHVIEGNFLIDTTFPSGFDSIIFCRVLCDWPDDICIKLLKMTYAALPPGGYVIICDPFRDSNHDLIVAWEYRYILWDDFGRAVFKEAVHYMRMLKAVGFRNIELSEDSPENMYRVLKAIK